MKETRMKKICMSINFGLFAKTRDRTKWWNKKNRTNNGMKWNNHTRCYSVHILLYFLLQHVWWHQEDLYNRFSFHSIFRSVFEHEPFIGLWYSQTYAYVMSLFTHNVFTLLLYICGAIFFFVFLINVFNKEFNYMENC
jgi:hypothetical protein